MRRRIVISPVLLLLLACVEPVRSATPASPALPAPASPLKITSSGIERPSVVFEDLFLQASDLREGMHSVTTPKPGRPVDSHFACFGGPGGTQSALSEWGDPDGREAIWRLVDLRWTFDDEASAEAFRTKTVAFLERKEWSAAPCDAPIGDACTRIRSGEEHSDGTPHTEIGFLFRIGPIVAEVTGAEGPRIGSDRIHDELVVPFARRAEERIGTALGAARERR